MTFYMKTLILKQLQKSFKKTKSFLKKMKVGNIYIKRKRT